VFSYLVMYHLLVLKIDLLIIVLYIQRMSFSLRIHKCWLYMLIWHAYC